MPVDLLINFGATVLPWCRVDLAGCLLTPSSTLGASFPEQVVWNFAGSHAHVNHMQETSQCLPGSDPAGWVYFVLCALSFPAPPQKKNPPSPTKKIYIQNPARMAWHRLAFLAEIWRAEFVKKPEGLGDWFTDRNLTRTFAQLAAWALKDTTSRAQNEGGGGGPKPGSDLGAPRKVDPKMAGTSWEIFQFGGRLKGSKGSVVTARFRSSNGSLNQWLPEPRSNLTGAVSINGRKDSQRAFSPGCSFQGGFPPSQQFVWANPGEKVVLLGKGSKSRRKRLDNWHEVAWYCALP